MLQTSLSTTTTHQPPSVPNHQSKRNFRHNANHQRRNHQSLRLIPLLALMIMLNFLQPPTVSAQVPNDVPAILSLIYSNIPQIKAGSDSRIGFGYAVGEQSDFQILFELGPQKFTKPIGEKVKSKRLVKKSPQRTALRSNVARIEKPSISWLEKWSSDASSSTPSKKKVSLQDITNKKSVVHKPELVQLLPTVSSQKAQQQQQQQQAEQQQELEMSTESVIKDTTSPLANSAGSQVFGSLSLSKESTKVASTTASSVEHKTPHNHGREGVTREPIYVTFND